MYHTSKFININLHCKKNKRQQNMITIQELLFNRGLDKNLKIKLIRHQDKRFPNIYDWYKYEKSKFLTYQSLQSKHRYNSDIIVSFIGEGSGTLSRFVGVFKIKGVKKYEEPQKIDDFDNIHYEYELEEIVGFEDLKERVIVKWNNAISWHQWIKNEMEVVEIHPGLHYKQFTDYSDFVINFEQLKEIVNNQYSDWKKMLSITKGIYLINDTKTGKLYVGSAYGEDGIWGRWSKYVSTNGHGDNKDLKDLVANDSRYGNNFQF